MTSLTILRRPRIREPVRRPTVLRRARRVVGLAVNPSPVAVVHPRPYAGVVAGSLACLLADTVADTSPAMSSHDPGYPHTAGGSRDRPAYPTRPRATQDSWEPAAMPLRTGARPPASGTALRGRCSCRRCAREQTRGGRGSQVRRGLKHRLKRCADRSGALIHVGADFPSAPDCGSVERSMRAALGCWFGTRASIWRRSAASTGDRPGPVPEQPSRQQTPRLPLRPRPPGGALSESHRMYASRAAPPGLRPRCRMSPACGANRGCRPGR
jgi:hypothetical protein